MTKAKLKKGLAFKFAKPADDNAVEGSFRAPSISKGRGDARRPAGDRGGNGGEVPVDLTDEQGS